MVLWMGKLRPRVLRGLIKDMEPLDLQVPVLLPSQLSMAALLPHQTCHPPLVWGKSPSPGEIFREPFPVIKGILKKTGTTSSALKRLGPSWPFNCSGTGPVPKSPCPSEEDKGPSRIPPHMGLSVPTLTSQCLCLRPLHFMASRAPTQRASQSGGLRVKYNEQTPSLGLARKHNSDVLKQHSHRPLKPNIAEGKLYLISTGFTKFEFVASRATVVSFSR